MKAKSILCFGGVLAGLGVALGAFAAHGLKKVLPTQMLDVFHTGVQYQFIHALALLICGILLTLELAEKPQKYFALAANCFIIGIFCFSGSLYALALTGVRWFGPVTPIGGFAFMLGWGLFVFAAMQIKKVNQ
ncbi:hypothetical protein GCM10007938_11100 [Vibrio zhanjiangensis]|uniref:DUF423 domain-containing protein n=1 Tax=Vibrio zhanjiangensis TaxID=1046128 RepID=A0ABQ6EVX5_9VIBR|nr:DUF423 domain-containing protein [Vibrio zhanjiangensis]GLT17333.1 hypothetical protein GCM10007938_11100 [Vibrio zhanjiangensis]